MEIAMTIARLSAPIHIAAQDAWISVLLAGIGGLVIAAFVIRIGLRYPNRTIVEYSQTILGRWLGHAIILPYLIFWISVAGAVLRVTCDFVMLSLFRETPIVIVALLLVMPAFYVTYSGGIEGIARCGQILGPIILVNHIGATLLGMNNIDVHRLLPVLTDTNVMQLFTGTLLPLALFGECTMVMMLIPFVTKPRKVYSSTLLAVGSSLVFAIFATATIIATFGPKISGKMAFPIYDMIKFISLMDFIQNLDVLSIPIWISAVFIKISLYLFISSYGTAQWLGIRKWQHMVIPTAMAIVVFALLPRNTTQVVEYTYRVTIPFATSILYVLIPLTLLIIGSLRIKSLSRIAEPSTLPSSPPVTVMIKAVVLLLVASLFGYWWMTGLRSPLGNIIGSIYGE